jgi:hypothetical protein
LGLAVLVLTSCGESAIPPLRCSLRIIAYATIKDLSTLVLALRNNDEPAVVRMSGAIDHDRTNLDAEVAASGSSLDPLQREVLHSEQNLAQQAASFVSSLPVVTDSASIDRLGALVQWVSADLTLRMPFTAPCSRGSVEPRTVLGDLVAAGDAWHPPVRLAGVDPGRPTE